MDFVFDDADIRDVPKAIRLDQIFFDLFKGEASLSLAFHRGIRTGSNQICRPRETDFTLRHLVKKSRDFYILRRRSLL